MQTPHQSEADLTQWTFNNAAVTVGGLYLATHSVVVTLIGTAAVTLLIGWTAWLPRRAVTVGPAPRTVCVRRMGIRARKLHSAIAATDGYLRAKAARQFTIEVTVDL